MGKRRNPLFVDSTKFSGDLVSMQIEVKNQTAISPAQLRMEIFGGKESPTQVPLVLSNPQAGSESTAAAAFWVGQVQLEHMAPFSYQLVLSSSEQLDIRGPVKEGIGGYILLEEWNDPMLVASPAPQAGEPLILALPSGEIAGSAQNQFHLEK